MRYNFMGLLILFFISSVIASENQQDALKQEAQQLVQQFVGQLKPQLKKAMEAGGPTQAIESCATLAPALADAISTQTGWKVRRVSLKTRNASRAQPDDWERSVLMRFDQRQVAGALPATINFGEIKGGHYRYMQAQGVEPLCLICHGEQLSASVKEMLDQYYPNEQATGYSLGQLRGAISLTKPLACDGPNDKDSKICQAAQLN
jgi:hypothetical protein